MKHFLLKKIKRVGATLVNHVFQAHNSVTRRLRATWHVVPRSLVCPRHHEFARLCPPQRPHAPRSRVCALCVCPRGGENAVHLASRTHTRLVSSHCTADPLPSVFAGAWSPDLIVWLGPGLISGPSFFSVDAPSLEISPNLTALNNFYQPMAPKLICPAET